MTDVRKNPSHSPHSLSQGLTVAQKVTNPFVAIVVASVTSILGLLPLRILIMNEPMSTFKGQLISTVAFLGWTILLFAWLKYYEKRSFRTLGFPKKGLKLFLLGGLVGLIFSTIVAGINLATGQVSLSHLNLSALPLMMVLLIGFIIQGSTEEIAYRGFLMQNMARTCVKSLALTKIKHC